MEPGFEIRDSGFGKKPGFGIGDSGFEKANLRRLARLSLLNSRISNPESLPQSQSRIPTFNSLTAGHRQSRLSSP